MEEKNTELEQITRRLLQLIGEDTNREGLQRTPVRVAKCIQQLTCGYEMDAAAVLNSAKFKQDYRQMIVVKDIEFYSLCEHHILPFFGKVHVGYIPDGTIVGLSKIPRVVDIFARRLQVQEHLTVQIRRCIEETLQPKGLNWGLQHCRQVFYQLSHEENPGILEWVAFPFSSGSS